MRPGRPAWVLVFFGLLICASRVPLAPGQLFTFDDVNLAYSIGHFDIRTSQPHPPGYPLFVMEMRMLWWLRFRRVENILLALSLAGSLAALLLLVRTGNRILGVASGFWAACLMLLHPVFWHAGVASALRVQLAVVSLAVAACCWNAWRGDGRWVVWSAVALGLGAGIRPETGPLLFPLWAASAWRAPVSWRQRFLALGAMTAAVLVWLLPAMMASGGPYPFVKACLDYLSDQASVSSGLFGATDSKWRVTFWRMITWIFCGSVGVLPAAVLAWRRKEGWGIGRERLAFLALWFLPPFAFAILVHIEDPGQALAMVPVVALCGGYLLQRAIDQSPLGAPRWQTPGLCAIAMGLVWLTPRYGYLWWAAVAAFAGYLLDQALERIEPGVPRRQSFIIAAAAAGSLWVIDNRDARTAVTAIALIGLAAGVLLKLAGRGGLPRRWQMACLLLAPVITLDCLMFLRPGWYYRGPHTSGVLAGAEQVVADVNSGLALTSLYQIGNTLAIDDHTLREMRRLADERQGDAVVVWEHGLTSWRKASYYAPDVPILVLEHRMIRAGSPPVVAVWRGSRLEDRTQGEAPLRVELRPGERIVWVLNPNTEFYDMAKRNFPLTSAGPVWYTDLPAESGSRLLGEYRLAW